VKCWANLGGFAAPRVASDQNHGKVKDGLQNLVTHGMNGKGRAVISAVLEPLVVLQPLVPFVPQALGTAKREERSKTMYPGSVVTSLICCNGAWARNPSSMLHPVHGFQFFVGGDHDTTPPAGEGWVSGRRPSRSHSGKRESDEAP
jgi:hypothetical protein